MVANAIEKSKQTARILETTETQNRPVSLAGFGDTSMR
jgi:hypothetical protein